MKRINIYIAIVLSLSIMSSGLAYADGDQCGGGPQAIPSETTSVLSGAYKLYVKLALPGQSATVALYQTSDDSGCQILGSAAVNGSTWTEVGGREFAADKSIGFEIDGAIPGDNEAAARPKLLFVPEPSPCTPAATCETTISGASAYLSPIALSTSESGLLLQKINLLSQDQIARVEYYTNGQLMYTEKGLQPFNTTYVDYYQQKIARVIVYSSGQRAVLEGRVDTYTDNLWNFAVRTYVRHSTVVIVAAIVIILITLLVSTRKIAVKIEARNYYNYAHGLGQHPLTPLELKVRSITQNRMFRGISNTLILGSSLIAAIIIVNSFILAPYKVDGTSMKGTLANGQLVAVNKLPVTLNRQFQPKRGEIIIFHPNYGNIVYSDLRVDNLLVKRIIGLPGERVVSADGKLRVYNSAHPSGYSIEDEESWAKHVTVRKDDAPFDITLANDQIFVAGDNRPDSIDSRINGALSLSEVVGVVIGY